MQKKSNRIALRSSSGKTLGFTLIELMVAIFIFAIISIMSYRIISSLVTTKQVVTQAQDKWGGIARAVNKISTLWSKAIPLAVRDENGMLVPAVLGKNKLSGNFDAQIEFTTAGFIGDPEYGSVPPRRIGFRYLNGKLYMITWLYMNRALGNQPQVELLLDNVDKFTVEFLYPDKVWRDTWPLDIGNFVVIPPGFRIYIKMKSKEEITRQWAN
ncbi:MAG: ral secretion pathway protein [Pseudomonadota bacterium]|nr:ral secretion pathway protein [Pseudomonadota bacterium]